jgi:hypothetical protein
MGKISNILGKHMSGEEPPMSEPEMDDMDMEEDESSLDDKASLAATKKVLKAIKGGDVTALRDALKTLISSC